MVLINNQVMVKDRDILCIGHDRKMPKIFKIMSLRDGEIKVIRHFTVS